MYPKPPVQSSNRSVPSSNQSQQAHNTKKYLNYINFKAEDKPRVTQNSPKRGPDHIPNFNINPHQNPLGRAGTSNNSASINRNPYINGPLQSRKDPPKQQTLSRNTSSKDGIVSRTSNEFNKNISEAINNYGKTSIQGFHRTSTEFNQSDNKPTVYASPINTDMGPGNYSKTVDLGAIRYQQIDQTYAASPEEELLKQKINYLEVLQSSLRVFERNRATKDLRQLNEDNRQLMMTVFEEIIKLKEDRSTRTISDCVSEVDNYSQNGYGTDNRSEGRGYSGGERPDRRRSRQRLSRSRDKDSHQRQIEKEMKLSETLKQQYDEEVRKANSNETSQLEKLQASIKIQQREIQSLTAKNNEIASRLTSLPFYQQWKIMCGEAQGAKKTKTRIREQLEKRKERLKQAQKGSTKNQPLKSQETVGNQMEEGREGSSSKNKIPVMGTLKIPPSPMHRPHGSSLQNSAHRSIPDSSIKMNPNQNRSKSINRGTTNI